MVSFTHDDGPNVAQDTPAPRSRLAAALNIREYAVGIILLLLVVLLWTLSNFVTQDMYQGGYSKPFLLTYLNTSAFSLYLIPFVIRHFWSTSSPSLKASLSGQEPGYQPLLATNDNDTPASADFQPEETPRDVLPPLTERETAHLAFAFCLLWFTANWTVNASLEYTSVASATILTSMSGFFTLGIGRIFKVERLTLIKFGAVCTSFFGVILVSLSDANPNKSAGPALLPKAYTALVDARATVGDILALISALFYAIYVILLKVRIKSESRIDMQLFFGFVGLFNILTCWPLGVVLHLTGVEKLELPATPGAVYAILVNMVITLSSDYFYVLAMLKTTPLLVTVGLSLTIPLAVLGDFLRGQVTHWQVLLGAALVLTSFVAMGLEDTDAEGSY